MKLTEHQARAELRLLVESLDIEVPEGWNPFTSEEDDKYILQWVKHPDNTWCSGKKKDFETQTSTNEYVTGLYARTIMTILGIRLFGEGYGI